jgi:hypothetical protein
LLKENEKGPHFESVLPLKFFKTQKPKYPFKLQEKPLYNVKENSINEMFGLNVNYEEEENQIKQEETIQ